MRRIPPQIRAYFEATPVAIVVAAVDGTVAYVNPALEDLSGRTASELQGGPVDALIPPEAHARHIAELAGYDGAPRSLAGPTVALLHADGTRIPVEVALGPLETDEGKLVVATILDRRKLLSALDTTGELETVFRLSPRPIWVFDAETWRFLAVNDATIAKYGYTEAELLAGTVDMLRGPEERKRLRETYGGVAPIDRYQGLWHHRARDGREFWVEVELQPLTFRGRPARIVAGTDVTDRLVVEQRLAAANAELDTILRSAPLPISMIDAQGLVRNWNDAAARVYGWTREEVVGKPHPLFSGRAGYLDHVRDALEAGDVRIREIQCQTRDGRERTVEVHSSVIDVPGHGRAGVLAVMIDVTEQRAVEARLRAAERVEAVGMVAGGVAHDFNNLLTAVLANSELALGELLEDDPLRAMLEDIRDAAERAAALTRQLLAFTRQHPIEPQHTDVNGRLRVIERVLRRLLRADVRLDLELAPVVPPVWCDPTQIDQIVMNLVLNARDAVGESGRIRISTRHELREDGSFVLLVVEDDGTGIAPEILPRIFAPFVSTKASGKGTGLGLAIVQRIVSGCGGRVSASNVEPHGARFEVQLPASQRTAIASSDESAPVRGGSETILLVEDDPDVRSVARRILANLGYRVLEARGVRDAQRVHSLAEHQIDLAFIDLVLPDGSGHALGLTLRTRDPRLAVLYTSGFTTEAGAWEGSIGPLLGKPYHAAALGRRVRALLDERKERGET